ncbi:PIG-L deacetylase family protein [Roseateles terrae]|uniref:LmbE family N-acetylglucosaminyl deacetylase n=1 Tax=Roseateles terrae TaxID=431060 RepID=A0ABR6GXC1_9BURK|nr:PIG-L deacetylase family protein [Roseateles terrae]MBB3196743.1 LmbE family N-acetylglucosaminyl deacetylase [Roseateles terrae]
MTPHPSHQATGDIGHMGDIGDRRIEGAGTSETQWWAQPTLHRLPAVDVHALLKGASRLVVVAPHPDDEVLGCGGLLAMAAQAATSSVASAAGGDDHSLEESQPVLIGVTDGEASHPDSPQWTPAELVRQRACERARGLTALGSGVSLRLLRLPDGQVADQEAQLMQKLAPLLMPDDLVVTTWRRDGHPDHEACGRACAALADRIGFRLLEMPVWMWHWASPGDVRVPWHQLVQLPLPEDIRQRKQSALRAHRSQVEPDGHRPPVLPASAMERLLRPAEFFFREETE